MSGHKHREQRRTILSAALYSDGERGDNCLIDFCRTNHVQFAATLCERSATILRYIPVDSFFRLGKRCGGTRVVLPGPSDRTSFVAKLIGEDNVKPLAEGMYITDHGFRISLPTISAEFHHFFGFGFVCWGIGCGKSGMELALALGVTEHSVSNYRGILRRARRPLSIAPFAPDFARYWAMIFPEADFPAAEADSPSSATHVAANSLNADLNAPAGRHGVAEGVDAPTRRKTP